MAATAAATAVLAAAAAAAALLALPAIAKLPPLSPEAQAKAAEAAAKTAWTEKVGLYKVCQSMDRVAARYRQTASAPAAPIETPPCVDPGPLVPPVAQAAPGAGAAPAPAGAASTVAPTPVTGQKDKPIEASEAHSPPGTALSPPSSKPTASELGTGKTK